MLPTNAMAILMMIKNALHMLCTCSHICAIENSLQKLYQHGNSMAQGVCQYRLPHACVYPSIVAKGCAHVMTASALQCPGPGERFS